MASTRIQKNGSFSTNSGYVTKFTFSCWVKRNGADLGTYSGLFASSRDDNWVNSRFKLHFRDSDRLGWEMKDSGGSDDNSFETNMLFRDPNAWYHIVFTYDGTEGTEANRLKLWVNGVDIRNDGGGFSSLNEAGSGFESYQDTNTVQYIGAYPNNSGTFLYLDGYMADVYYTVENVYTASTFGETDATTGEWKPKTDPSVTYGTGGFNLKFENAANLDLDSGTNGYTFTTNGTLTQSIDNPSHNFATLQHLFKGQNNLTISTGSNKAVEGSNNWRAAYSSIGMDAGKFYCEAKITYQSGNEAYVGCAHEDHINGNASYGGSWGGVQQEGYDYIGYSDKSVGMYSNGNIDYPSTINVGGTWQSSGDIIGIAMDLDNNKIYFSKNGVWANGSGAWGSSTFDSGVGGQTKASGLTFFGFSPNESTWEVNFGNGYFGSTAVTSAQNPDDGVGIFEYTVPTGYKALCTKGLNS